MPHPRKGSRTDWCGIEKHVLVVDVPVYGRGVETKWS